MRCVLFLSLLLYDPFYLLTLSLFLSLIFLFLFYKNLFIYLFCMQTEKYFIKIKQRIQKKRAASSKISSISFIWFLRPCFVVSSMIKHFSPKQNCHFGTFFSSLCFTTMQSFFSLFVNFSLFSHFNLLVISKWIKLIYQPSIKFQRLKRCIMGPFLFLNIFKI